LKEEREKDLADMTRLIDKTLELFFVSALKKIDGHLEESYDLPLLMDSLDWNKLECFTLRY